MRHHTPLLAIVSLFVVFIAVLKGTRRVPVGGGLKSKGRNPHLHALHDEEFTTPIFPVGEHFLNQISAQGEFLNEEYEAASVAATDASAASDATDATLMIPLYMTTNIRTIRAIEPGEEQYDLKLTMYFMWSVDPNTIAAPLLAKAQARHFYSLTDDEIAELQTSHDLQLPSYKFANAKEVSASDETPSVRVYASNDGTKAMVQMNQGRCALSFFSISLQAMACLKESSSSHLSFIHSFFPSCAHFHFPSFRPGTQGFSLTLSQTYPLRTFPFDLQRLHLSVKQDDSRTWDQFNLTTTLVQFHRSALEMSEWRVHGAEVIRSGSRGADIFIHVKREVRLRRCVCGDFVLPLSHTYLLFALPFPSPLQPAFFVTNVCAITFLLSATVLIAFALPTGDLDARVNVVLTLLLTAVAFKLIIAESIPKVGYSTLMDDFVLTNMAFLFLNIGLMVFAYLTEHHANKDDEKEEEEEEEEEDEAVTSAVNGVIATISLVVLLAFNLGWYAMVIFETQQDEALMSAGLTEPLIPSPGRTWYAFSFANPSFLPSPGSGKLCTIDCPAGVMAKATA